MQSKIASGALVTNTLPEASLKWAFNAYDRFLGTLSPEVRRHLGERREDAYTVVFGRAQVGKSTLILHLLGLQPDAISAVSAVLRGGRKVGNSSTALPTEYRRSSDERWRIRWGSEARVCASDDEAEAEFAGVRALMERNGASPTAHLCDVEIPAHYFDTENTVVRGTRILDLPGADASNPDERKFVTRVAESLVPNADLILLVGRADDLSFLMTDQLKLPGIADWQLSPRRFRVVTTYSFTPESVREFARETGCEGDVSAYRERLIGEIQRFRTLEPDVQAPELYFPLELGESWKGATDLHLTPLKTMMDNLMQRLRQDIADANTPLSRLEGALDAHVVITKVHTGHLKAIEKDERRLEVALANRATEVNRLETSFHKQNEQLEERQSDLLALTDAKIANGAAAPGVKLSQWAAAQQNNMREQINGPSITTDTLLSAIGEVTRSLGTQIPRIAEEVLVDGMDEFPAFWRRVYKLVGQLKAANITKASAHIFSELNARLEGYWIKSYFRKGDNSHLANDIDSFIDAYCHLIDEISKALTFEITQHAKIVKHQMLAEIRFSETQSADTNRLLVGERSAFHQIMADITKLKAKREQAELFIKREIQHSLQFTALLAEEYNRAVENAYRGVLDAPDTLTAFEQLVLGSTLRKAHETVWTRISGVVKQ